MAHRQLRIEQSPLERARLWVEILAFLAAGAWALYTFVYQTKLAPGFLPPHEIVSVDVQRVGTTRSSYFERVNLTLDNDGSVDIDTTALAVTVYGLKPSAETRLQTSTAANEDLYRELPQSAWQPLLSHGILFESAIGGKPEHIILRPGDKASNQELAVIPREYHVLMVHLLTRFDRYPIAQRVEAKLGQQQGAVLLHVNGNISSYSYFGV